MRWKKSLVAAMTAMLMLAGGTALADTADEIVASDAVDDVLTNQGSTQKALAFGNVCAGTAPTLDVTLEILRGTHDYGNTNVFENSASVNITNLVTPDAGNTATAANLVPGAAGPIVLPSDWGSAGTTSAPATSTVQFTAGTVSGTYLAELRYTATGRNSNNGNNRSVFTKFDVTATVIACSSDTGKAAPAIANEYINGFDSTQLASCMNTAGTNKNKSNWRGNVISTIAHEFNPVHDQPWDEEDVQARVRQLCGLA